MLRAVFDELLAANERYTDGFALGSIPARAAKSFALVSCMDSRIEPLAMLGLQAGDAKILRNAGGRVTPDVLRSLILATTYLGVTHVAVMHHTGCALVGTDDGLREGLTPAQQAAAAGIRFLAMPDPDAALEADVEAVRSCAALAAGIRVEGWRYDVGTGRVARIVRGSPATPEPSGG
jgi:carbonic anhydrase